MAFKCFNCNSAENLFGAPQTHEMRDRWMELFPECDVNIFNESFRICAEHFDNKYILPSGMLSARAVPTKFLVHNVWCEIEDENDDQQDNHLEYSTTSEQQIEKDFSRGQHNMSPTDPEVLLDCYANDVSSSFIDTLYSRSLDTRSTQAQLSSKHTSTPIASRASPPLNMTNSRAPARNIPLINTTQQRLALVKQQSASMNSAAAPAMKSEGIFSGMDSLGVAREPTSFGSFENTATARPFKSSLNSSYPANGTFSPLTNYKKSGPYHKPFNHSSKSALFASRNSIFDSSDKISKKSFSSQSESSKSQLFDASKLHQKRDKLSKKIDHATHPEKIPKTSKPGKQSSQQPVKKEWERPKKPLMSVERHSKNQPKEVRHEASYSTKRRKKVPIVLMKRLKFPNNVVPPLGTLLNIEMMEQLNTFQVNVTAPAVGRKRVHDELVYAPNGLFGRNSSAARIAVVDLTQDDDDSEIESPPAPAPAPAPTSPQNNNSIKRTSAPVEYVPPETNGTVELDSEEPDRTLDDTLASETLDQEDCDSFQVRQDVPLGEQVKLYQAELKRVKTIQMSLYSQYNGHTARFKKLQDFLDQLASSGLIMKRNEK